MIGIFDSGFGGLTVLSTLQEQLPIYDYLYLGDSARAPYGGRSQATIKDYTRAGLDFLFEQGASMVVVACNTASAEALHDLQIEMPERKILGVLIPVAEATVEYLSASKNKTIGVVATRATIESRAYEREIHKLDDRIRVIGQACPLLVAMVEEGWSRKPECRSILRKYLRHLKSQNPAAVILGCTHYPILKNEFAQILGKQIRVLSPELVVAEKLAEYLERHPEIEAKLSKNTQLTVYTTDDPLRFATLGRIFFSGQLPTIKKANL